MKCRSPTGKNFESVFLKLILPCVGKKTPINCSGMPLEWLWGGEWAFMIFDRLKTSVQSGFLELKQAEFKLSSWEWDLCRVPAGREGGSSRRQGTMPPFRLPVQPSHICLHGLCPPWKRVVLPPPFHLTWPWTVSGLRAFPLESCSFEFIVWGQSWKTG